MKLKIDPSTIAQLAADKIATCIAITCAIDVLQLSGAARGSADPTGLLKATRKNTLAIQHALESILAEVGWEIRHTSPMISVCVPVKRPLHADLSHVGAVGEGSMPGLDPEPRMGAPGGSKKPNQNVGSNTARANTKKPKSNRKS